MKAILFVDDQEVLARLACEILRMQGYRAECAYNATEALSKFEKETFDLLVTDYRMEGMNGLELARLLRSKAPGLPVIIVSGYEAVEVTDDMVLWIEKQDMFPALLDKVKFFLGEGERQVADRRQTLKSA